MSNAFFKKPILNSPYEYPARHWELDENGLPTQRIVEKRRPAEFVTPIPKPKMAQGAGKQGELNYGYGGRDEEDGQAYDVKSIINEVRSHVDAWRRLDTTQAQVTPATARLLQHWRHHEFSSIRPFFCQLEAAETAIWLTEVAPNTKDGKRLLRYLSAASEGANPGLSRLALKLATGAGKTTVMAMLIAWQTVNAVRSPNSKRFTHGFLVVTPGLTIKDRLRVLIPNDPDNYYTTRELIPHDLIDEVQRAKVVVTNYHAFKLRERMNISKGNRQLLEGRRGRKIQTTETEGQMIQRVMPELMGMKSIMVLNDEAHHCYREKPADPEEEKLSREEKEEAQRNNEAARLWISGLEIVNRKLSVKQIVDLSATPFFLRGSGYREGTLFPWTMSDFSLMDAIECGIVKLPRVPVSQNIPGHEMPIYRELWKHVREDMPKKGRGKGGTLDPLKLPAKLQTALQVLYGHYEKTFTEWEKAGVGVPPCFIVVCQNTAISKLVYDWIAGFYRRTEDGGEMLENGRLGLFRNFDGQTGNPLPRPRTLLIDSEQLEAGEELDAKFRAAAADELERFRRERVERSGQQHALEDISDQEILREAMNTVGKPGQLGAGIRCVVSVSMLTEGWDANNVTHILGIRAFGTQLLCEQVIGRALRRQSYEVDENGLFGVEYADVFGVPFDFTSEPVDAPVQPPKETIQVRAVSPDRDHLEIRFPRVEGYRVELPTDRLTATFNEDSVLELTPELVGPSKVEDRGIIGESAELNLEHLDELRKSKLLYELTRLLVYRKWRGPGEDPPLNLFGQLKRITREWLDSCLVCKGGTYPGLLMYRQLAEMACERITAGINRSLEGEKPIKAVLDPYNPSGSTRYLRFTTTKTLRWDTSGPPPKNHVNWVILDSDWEGEFCRIVERHPRVIRYTKNHNLGFEVPYRYGAQLRRYRPDFIVQVDDGHGADDPLNMIVEIKGYRGRDAQEKKATMENYWVRGVNNLRTWGRWDFAELTDVFEMESDFEKRLERWVDDLVKTGGVRA